MAYRFYGGVHPASDKKLTSDKPVKQTFIPQRVVIPLLQSVGTAAEPVVAVGDNVKTADMIGKPTGTLSSAVHSSISGRVTKIAYSNTRMHPRVLSVMIESQGAGGQEFSPRPQKDIEKLSRQELLDMIRDSGIVGLGGGVFPSHVKLSPVEGKPIGCVLLNGAECEPYITCDHRLMLEEAPQIIKGLRVILKITGAKNACICAEDNKPDAVSAMKKALGEDNIEVKVLKTKYPQGSEKQLIKSILGQTVPAGGLPMDIGCLVHNVATAFAIYETVYLGKPLIDRIVTLTGSCIKEPVNLRVRVGTMLSDLIASVGGLVKEPAKVICGGPMMGISQYTMDVPITKGANAFIFLSGNEVDNSREGVCIRCAKCLEACPMGLSPTSIMYRVKRGLFVEMKALGAMHCFECGVCGYVCPAKIPLLDYIKYGKSKFLAEERHIKG